MARQNGRDLRIKRGATIIAVLNTKTVNIANTPVDVTGDDDAGFVTYLSRAGTKQISLDCSGFTDSDDLRDAAVTGVGLLAEHTIEWLSSDGLGTVVYAVVGDFYMDSFAETGASDGALEFTCTLKSSGEYERTIPV